MPFGTIVPKTLQVNPGIVIRIKIGEPIDLSSYHRSDKNRLMEEVHRIMSTTLQELRGRRKP